MAVQDMVQEGSRLFHSESVSDGTTTDPVMIRNPGGNLKGMETVLVGVKCSTANTIQCSLDKPSIVIAGSADWFDWEPGEVTADEFAELPAQVTAVRCVNSGASASTFKVVA